MASGFSYACRGILNSLDSLLNTEDHQFSILSFQFMLETMWYSFPLIRSPKKIDWVGGGIKYLVFWNVLKQVQEMRGWTP